MRVGIPRFPAIASAMLAGAICANALLFQEGSHPAPLFGDARGKQSQPAGAVRTLPATTVPAPIPAAETRNQAVEDLQRSLRTLGYYDGAVDGRFGPQTQASVIAYQRAHALEPTGVPSEALLRHSLREGRPVAPLPPELPGPARHARAGKG